MTSLTPKNTLAIHRFPIFGDGQTQLPSHVWAEVTLEKYLELDKYNAEDARLMLNEAQLGPAEGGGIDAKRPAMPLF